MSQRGFTLLEIVIALAIAGLVLAVSVPAGARFYESMQYRGAVRDVVTMLSTARHRAVEEGRAKDVEFNPRSNEVSLEKSVKQMPSALNLTVSSAAELGQRNAAVIRFYPEGGSSGGEVSIAMPGQSGVHIVVDWLLGGITQEKYAFD